MALFKHCTEFFVCSTYNIQVTYPFGINSLERKTNLKQINHITVTGNHNKYHKETEQGYISENNYCGE